MTLIDNPTGQNMSTVKPQDIKRKEEMCYIYFYSYAPDYAEAPSSTWQPRGIPTKSHLLYHKHHNLPQQLWKTTTTANHRWTSTIRTTSGRSRNPNSDIGT